MKLSDIRRIRQQFSMIQPNPEQIEDLFQLIGYDASNLYQELEMDSRFVDTHRDSTISNDHVQLHSHTFFEILYCNNSCGAEYLVGSERYRLQQGDVIIIPPGVSHRPLLPEVMTEPYLRDVLWISTDLITTLQNLYPKEQFQLLTQTHLLRTMGTRWESIGELFHRGVQESERQNIGWEAAVLGNTLQIITQLRRATLERTVPLKAENPDLLDQIIAYIEANLEQKITLSDVAHHFFVSESTITHTFRQKMGVSFYHCVTQRRLITAKTLIQQGHRLELIGERIGFTDYSSFYRAFKKEFGISPRQYRKLLSEESHTL